MLSKYRVISVLMLIAVLAVAGTMVWRMTGNEPQAIAQTVIEDACDASENFYNFDMRVQIEIANPYYPIVVHDSRVNVHRDIDLPPNEHGTVFYETTNERGEYIYIYSPLFDAMAASGTSERIFEYGNAQLIEFSRDDNDLGIWEEWESSVSEFPIPTRNSGSAAGLDAKADSFGEVPGFCGWQVEGFGTIKLVGEETLGGKKTSHYIATLYRDGSDSEEYGEWEWWIDDTGLLRKYKLGNYKPDGIYRIETVELSGFGEPNIIVAPVNGTLHEAFLEMGTDGTAVGFTSAAGELEPAGFNVEGAGPTDIQELKWQDGKVSLTLETFDPLTGYVLDFFDVDGEVSLSLDAASATSVDGKLSWPVAEAPWSDGDYLMLRIRETGSAPIPLPTPKLKPTITPVPGVAGIAGKTER